MFTNFFFYYFSSYPWGGGGGSRGQLLNLELPNVWILRDEGLQLIYSFLFVMIRSGPKCFYIAVQLASHEIVFVLRIFWCLIARHLAHMALIILVEPDRLLAYK